MFRRWSNRSLGLLVALQLIGAVSLVKADAAERIAPASPQQRVGQEIEISTVVTDLLTAGEWFPGRLPKERVSAKLDVVRNHIVVDMGFEYGDLSASSAMEDFQKEITVLIFDLLGKPAEWQGIELRFGGFDMYYWFPELREPPGGDKESCALYRGG